MPMDAPDLVGEQAKRTACAICDMRRRQSCVVDGKRCVEHVRADDCPLGRFVTCDVIKMDKRRSQASSISPHNALPLFIRENQPIYLQGLYRGRSAFLICGGPSFRELDLAKLRTPGIITMGINNSPRTFRPNLWVHGDVPDNFIRSVWTDPTIIKFSPLSLRHRRIFDSDTWSWTDTVVSACPGVFFYKLGTGHRAEIFLSGEHAIWGNTEKAGGVRSTFMIALRLLHELGFAKVFLLGADFHMEASAGYHFEQRRARNSVLGNNRSYGVVNQRCVELVPIFEKAGLNVFNCNPKSKLTAFPYITFEQAIAAAQQEFGNIDVQNERTDGLYDSPKPDPQAITIRPPEQPVRYSTPGNRICAVRLSLPETGAFNAAMASTPNGTLCVYRTGGTRPSLASCYLDDDLRVMAGTHQPLSLCRNDDPRLVTWANDVYLISSYNGDGYSNERVELRRLYLAGAGVKEMKTIAKFSGIGNDPCYRRCREKNWVPFVHQGELYFVHWMNPHRILRYYPNRRTVSVCATTEFVLPSGWPDQWAGELRLSTNPVRLACGSYLSSFHTWCQHQGYFNGFYLFDGEPPFRVRKVSMRPFTMPADATGKNRRNGRDGVVFLQTMIVDEQRGMVRLSGGDNDHSPIVLEMTLHDVLSDLQLVESKALPTLSVVTPVKGRRDMLQQTAESIMAQKGVHQYVVVDYGCPDKSGEWVKTNYPSACVLTVADPLWSLSKARNAGIDAVTGEWVVILDVDIVLSDRFIERLAARVRPGHFYVAKERKNGLAGFLACRTQDLRSIGGYDVQYTSYGYEDDDVIRSLLRLGLQGVRLGGLVGQHINHGVELRTRYYEMKSLRKSLIAMDAVQRKKWGISGAVDCGHFPILYL